MSFADNQCTCVSSCESSSSSRTLHIYYTSSLPCLLVKKPSCTRWSSSLKLPNSLNFFFSFVVLSATLLFLWYSQLLSYTASFLSNCYSFVQRGCRIFIFCHMHFNCMDENQNSFNMIANFCPLQITSAPVFHHVNHPVAHVHCIYTIPQACHAC